MSYLVIDCEEIRVKKKIPGRMLLLLPLLLLAAAFELENHAKVFPSSNFLSSSTFLHHPPPTSSGFFFSSSRKSSFLVLVSGNDECYAGRIRFTFSSPPKLHVRLPSYPIYTTPILLSLFLRTFSTSEMLFL